MPDRESYGFLSIEHLGKSYGSTRVLHDVSLSVDEKEFVAFLGPSGCGKTTLLNAIAGISSPSSGLVRLEGKDITFLPPEKRHFGFVFQGYALFPNLTVEQNVAYGLSVWDAQKRYNRVHELLELVSLASFAAHYPGELSGGQQQRVALARALAPRPRILLLDEPLSALDARIRFQLAEELRRLQRSLGITTIMVTHDQQEAMSMADRIVIMNEGRIVQTGTPSEIYEAPANRFVASFIGSMNFLSFSFMEGCEYGIRCEDIKVLEATSFTLTAPHTWTARIEDIRYLGSCVRMEVLLQDYATRLYAEMPASAASQFRVGNIVAVRLPQDMWRSWKD